jgi:hypothetical protein
MSSSSESFGTPCSTPFSTSSDESFPEGYDPNPVDAELDNVFAGLGLIDGIC